MGVEKILFHKELASEIATIIWKNLNVGESVIVTGFVKYFEEMDMKPRGELVLRELERIDKFENIRYINVNKKQRKYKFLPDAIGGPIAQKIFKWDKHIVDSEIRYTIWRFQ